MLHDIDPYGRYCLDFSTDGSQRAREFYHTCIVRPFYSSADRSDADRPVRVAGLVTGMGLVGWRAVGAVLAALVASCALISPGTAGASALPTLAGLPVPDRPGSTGTTGVYTTAPASAAVARGELAVRLSGVLARRVRKAGASVRAVRASGQRVEVTTLQFGSAMLAEAIVSGWRAGVRRSRASLPRARVGAGGWILEGVGGVRLVWRDGSIVGVVDVAAAGRGYSLHVAQAFARLVSASLQAPAPRTAWERVLSGVRPDGSVSKQTAMQAFSLVYARLPGVKVPNGRSMQLDDGTLAADWILRFRSKLTARQRRIVDRALGLRIGRLGARAATLGDPSFIPDSSLTDKVKGYMAYYVSQGVPAPTPPVQIIAGRSTFVTPNVKPGELVLGDSGPLDADGSYDGAYRICRVRLLPDGQREETRRPVRVDLALAHEAFHCMEWGFTNPTVAVNKPAWLREGMAEWAAYKATGAPYDLFSSIHDYIQNPGTPLFQRAYDAVGFFGHVDDTTGNFFARAANTFRADGVAAFAAAGGNVEASLSTWGPSVFRLPNVDGWTMISPTTPPGFPTLRPGGLLEIGDAGGYIAAAPLATAQARLIVSSAEPLIHVRVDGPARMYSYDHGELSDAHDVWLRTDGKNGCPEGTTGDPPSSTAWSQISFLAVTGDPSANTQGNVEPHSLDEFCKPKQTPPGGGGGSGGSGGSGCACGVGVGVGGSFADPHLLDFDGSVFDFQAAGEFTLLNSTQDNFEVQVRQQPFLGSRSVAINTAVAMRVGSATVEVDALRGDAVALYVNRRRVHGSGVRLGRGRLTLQGADATVTWPDGSSVRIFNLEGGLYVSIRLARHRLRHVVGLLGNWGVRASTEFVGRDGRHFPQSAILASDPSSARPPASALEVLYKEFGGSWRITQRESLFRYARGKSTRSYTIPGFPSQDLTAATLPPAALGAGQTACTTAGITNGQVFAGCELDVGATGDAGFATGDRGFQTGTGLPASAGAVSPIPWTQLSSQPDNDTILVPSLASQGSQMVAAYQHTRTSIEVGAFTPTATEVSGLSRVTPITGWTQLGDPLLFPRPGGGLQMIFSGLQPGPFNPSTSGTLVVPRNGDGSFAAPVTPAAGGLLTNLLRGAVLASDGLPLWTEYSSGGLQVYHGASAATSVNLNSEVPGTSYIATLAYDRSGRLWLAWYVITSNPATSGLYMLQLDPRTGNVAGGAIPLLVPDSQTSNNNDAQPALACRQSCRIVYQDSRSSSRLLSWAPGDQTPTTVTTDPTGPVADPTAAYATNGGLWVAWTESSSGRLAAKLGDGSGSGGAQVELPSPAGYDMARYSAAATKGNQLVLVTNWQANASTATAVFATVVNAH